MDTLPLNGNFNNSYSLRDDDYEDVGVRGPGDLGGLNLDDAAFEKMIISELVHNNLRPRRNPKGRDTQRERGDRAPPPPHTRVTVDQGGGGSCSEDDAIVADHAEASSPQSGGGVGGGGGGGGHPTLELLLHPHHKEALEAPLLPQRTHSLLYSAQKAPRRLERAGDRGLDTCAAAAGDTGAQSPSNNRDSLYTSMPNLRDSPSPSVSSYPPEEEMNLSPSHRSEGEDIYHKSMPELGDAPQPLSYYHINRGTSDGCIIPPDTEDCAPNGEAPKDGQMQLITSL